MQSTVLVKETLSELLKMMDISVKKLTVEEDDRNIIRAEITVEEKEAPLLIGFYGQHLNALQTLLKSLLWKKDLQEKSNVQLDVNEYRKKHEDRLIAMSEEKAESVRATNIPQFMPTLSPYMRRLIHLHLAQEKFADLETESVGEEGRRRIQIRKRGTTSMSLE